MTESETQKMATVPTSNEKAYNQRELGYRGIYLERSGESASLLVEQLLRDPELPLSPEDKQVAYEFEKSLSEYRLTGGDTIEEMVRATKSEDVVAPQLFPEFILNKTVDVEHLNSPALETHDDVFRWLGDAVHNGNVSVEQISEAVVESGKAYRKYMQGVLIGEEHLEESALVSKPVVPDPQEVVRIGGELAEARQFLLSLRVASKEESSRLENAKRAIADVYLAKINAMIGARIPIADYLHEQSSRLGDEPMADAATNLIPSGLRRAIENPKQRERLFTRLDYLRNGMGINESGHASTVMNESAYGADITTEAQTVEPMFTPEQVNILKQTQIATDDVVRLFERILARADMLSAEDPSTWSPKRRVRASDERFQVVKNPTKPTFAVDGVSGAYKVPPAGSSLYNIIATGCFHELQHITQAQADREMGQTLRIAGAMKGKRPSMIREGGANAAQREAELRLFGKAKPFALTYARALQSLERGEGLYEATRAFYQEKLQAMPEVAPVDAASEAADRVLRLVRGGGQDSQAMSYAEGGLLAQELQDASSEARTRAMAVTSLDLVDQVRLHRYGLLPKLTTSIDWNDHILSEILPLLPTGSFPGAQQ